MTTIKRFLTWFDIDRNVCIFAWIMSALLFLADETQMALSWIIIGLLYVALIYIREIHAAIIGGIEIKFRIEEDRE